MWKFYDDEDREPEERPVPTQAELTLRSLLDKQLSTSGRLERVEFDEITQSMCCIGHSSFGVHSLAQFRKNEVVETKDHAFQPPLHDPIDVAISQKNKRARYGSHPSFVKHDLHEEKVQGMTSEFNQKHESSATCQMLSRHSQELEASLMRGKDKLKAISHLSVGALSCRKPLMDIVQESVLRDGNASQECAHERRQDTCSRSAAEVFCCPAPDVLDLHSYLKSKQEDDENSLTTGDVSPLSAMQDKGNLSVRTSGNPIPRIISKEEILSNKLSEEDIRANLGKTFKNYIPGKPSRVLYIKNLSASVKETDLVALYLRFECPGKKLLFRLMQHGRMKGQAFVTFPDVDTACEALILTNGFILKGKPMVIQYGTGIKED